MQAKWYARFLGAMMLLVMVLSTVQPAAANSTALAGAKPQAHRYIVFASNPASFARFSSEAAVPGVTVVNRIPQANAVVVTAPVDMKAQLAARPGVQHVVVDTPRALVRPEIAQELGFNASPERTRFDMGHHDNHHPKVKPDPAFSLPGLMWNVLRIGAPPAWRTTIGKDTVLVGVADTGLDYTHSELNPKVAAVVNLADPTLCPLIYDGTPLALTDADWAAEFGGPADTDWNGHGSWIGGNIAGALDGVGINGIAPGVKLVSLKISEWCGYAYDSSILDAFYYAADHGIDVVSISFGGYLDRSDPDQDTIYKAYVDSVKYAARKGTVIVAAAGNEHLRIGAGGQVISHGPLTIPGDPFVDYYGLWETPGGIPGIVDVSATGNVVYGASEDCDPSTIGTVTDGDATCKPKSDEHQPFGVGRRNQLTYYSNYGPRIDVAGPGGARKFNLPNADRGGTGGFPYTDADGFKAFEDFSITSNWALEIPCFINLGPQFYPNECYSTIQGTSMATPHASAVIALIASSNRWARHHPAVLIHLLKESARDIEGNRTPGLSATDLSNGDRTGLACPTGYCHLGGRAISDHDAYGAGLVDAFAAVHGGHNR